MAVSSVIVRLRLAHPEQIAERRRFALSFVAPSPPQCLSFAQPRTDGRGQTGDEPVQMMSNARKKKRQSGATQDPPFNQHLKSENTIAFEAKARLIILQISNKNIPDPTQTNETNYSFLLIRISVRRNLSRTGLQSAFTLSVVQPRKGVNASTET